MIYGICGGLIAGLIVLLIGLLAPRRNCPKCGYKLPRFRKPSSGKQAMWGGWTCPSCGAELDRHGKLIGEGVGVPTAVVPPDATPKKICPKCAEKIQLDARFCIHCGQEFTDADIQASRQQAEDQARAAQQAAQERASQAQLVAKEKSSRNGSRALVIVGGVLAAAGALLTLLLILVMLFPTPSSGTESSSVSMAPGFICSVPLLLVGGVLIFLGRRRQRAAAGKENSVIPPTA